MKIKTWKPGMSDAETKDLAYWERNVLALHYADGWYNDDIPWNSDDAGLTHPRYGRIEGLQPRYKGWRRVLSLENGMITFHIPDDFDVGNLPEIKRNWDSHSTEEKWQRILGAKNIGWNDGD